MKYLNALHADHVVLECAHRPLEELQVFKDLKPEVGFGLGVIDIKSTTVESASGGMRSGRVNSVVPTVEMSAELQVHVTPAAIAVTTATTRAHAPSRTRRSRRGGEAMHRR